MMNVIKLERIKTNQQVKVTVSCANQEMKAHLLALINDKKNIADDLEIYPMANAGNKSESEILNFVLSFGIDVLDTVKDELVSIAVGYLISEIKNRKQKYVVEDKDQIVSNESLEDKD